MFHINGRPCSAEEYFKWVLKKTAAEKLMKQEGKPKEESKTVSFNRRVT